MNDMSGIPQQDVSNATVELTFGDVTYTIDRIRQGQVSQSIAFMLSRRMQSIIDATRTIETVSPESRGCAMAQVACKIFNLSDILNDVDARMHLMAQSLKVNGQAVPFEHVRSVMQPQTKIDIEKVWLELSTPKSVEGDANPTASTSTDPPT